MSVFTPVSGEQFAHWLRHYSIGTLTQLEGIQSGVENTNYFVTTTHGEYVLTLFERLAREDLPFYVNLMAHLARHGIPCPAPIADAANRYIGTLNGKPALIATRLPGASLTEPTPAHCAMVGEMLASMHLAAQSYGARMENPRGPRWWREAARSVMPFLSQPDAALLSAELRFQAQQRPDELPHGVIHADLFRDNVLFDNHNGRFRIGGIIDFYFAGWDALLFDVAIAVNDWCLDVAGQPDDERTQALLRAYAELRAFTVVEQRAWPVFLRAAALRFWLSRLADKYLPRRGEVVLVKDPELFRRILALRTGTPAAPPAP